MSFAGQDPARWPLLVQVALGLLLGSAIALGRQFAVMPAGLRTCLLVAGSGALLVALSNGMIEYLHSGLSDCLVRVDPLRIVHAVTTGVRFSGAGTTIHDPSAIALRGSPLAAPSSLLSASGSGRGCRSGCLSAVLLYAPGWYCAA